MEPALKQRLLGAAVLVALAVVFLPLLVMDPAPDSGASRVPLRVPNAPAEANGDTRTFDLPLATPADTQAPVTATPVEPPAIATEPAKVSELIDCRASAVTKTEPSASTCESSI